MTRILLTICFLMLQLGIYAQPLKFSNPSWGFGTIEEDGGEVSHTFEFVNSSSSPVVITSVKTSCGCTSTKYSREPIGVGKSSTFEVVYDPMYRPGAFARNISIYTSASKEPVVVSITGNVTPRKKSLSEQYPYLLGEDVRISSLYSYMQNVSPASPQQSQIEIINSSDKSQTIEFKTPNPSGFLNIDAPKTLAAAESAKVNLSYIIDPNVTHYGELNDIVEVYVGGKKSNMTLRTRAYAVDDFNNNQDNRSISGLFSEKFINFAKIKTTSKKLTREFTIENLGVEPLIVRSVDSPSGVIVTAQGKELEGVSIPSAEMVTVQVALESDKLEFGAFVKYITIIINDPESPVVRIKVVGEVSK